MIITLMVLALVTALATTVAVVTINNLQASWRAQQAGAALNAADAGIAQAMSYLRNSGVRDLACPSETSTSPACWQPWGHANKAQVSLPGKAGQGYQVWIEARTPFPANDPGRYRIHAIGIAAGQARREVVSDVEVTTTDVPKGIFARTVSGGGTAKIARESIFSTGCVYNRSKIQMSGTDAAYGIPVAVHSSQIITDSSGSGQYCPDTNKPIHRTGAQYLLPQPCNTAYRYDQDRLGGSLSSSSGCETVESTYAKFYAAQDLDKDGATDVVGSLIKDDATLFDLFDIKTPALTQAQIDQMRTIAQSQLNYHTSATGWASPDEANAVMFFDLSLAEVNRRTVDLNDITGFGRAANLLSNDAGCTSRSLIIVVEGGNVRLNSNRQLAASVFLTSSAPYGQVLNVNGTADFIGTIYADNVNLTGTANLSMDQCFLSNVSPALLDFSTSSYRELDRLPTP